MGGNKSFQFNNHFVLFSERFHTGTAMEITVFYNAILAHEALFDKELKWFLENTAFKNSVKAIKAPGRNQE